MAIDYDKFKDCLPIYLRSLGRAPEKNFRCIAPWHADSNPSMSHYESTHEVHCHGCGFHGDIYDAVGAVEGIASKAKQYIRVQAMYGIEQNSSLAIPPNARANKKSQNANKEKIIKSHSKPFLYWHKKRHIMS